MRLMSIRETPTRCSGLLSLISGLAARALRSRPFGPFASGHAACTGKRRALRRMPAACEVFYERTCAKGVRKSSTTPNPPQRFLELWTTFAWWSENVDAKLSALDHVSAALASSDPQLEDPLVFLDAPTTG